MATCSTRFAGTGAKDGSMKEHGPYWYFRYHEGGRQRTLYLGKDG